MGFRYAISKLVDDNDSSSNQARVRLYHAAGGLPGVNMNLNGALTFADVDYTQLTDYFTGSSEVSEDRTTMIVAIDIKDEFTPEVDSSASAIGASIITTAVFVAL